MTENDESRRDLLRLVAGATAAATALGMAGAAGAQLQRGGPINAPAAADHTMPTAPSSTLPGPRPQIAMLIHPKMVLLDLVGALTAFNIAQCDVYLVWKERVPVRFEVGIEFPPSATFDECPRNLDAIVVPGGIMGTIACMNDPVVLAFLADRAKTAKWVVSICTGGLTIAAAGLLRGYKAATFWPVMDILPIMGAIPTHERVVVDRNRITCGGVTSGIDLALVLVAKLRSEAVAKRVQLMIEYAPHPPFHSGTPEEADPALVAEIRTSRLGMDGMARTAAQAAAKRFGI